MSKRINHHRAIKQLSHQSEADFSKIFKISYQYEWTDCLTISGFTNYAKDANAFVRDLVLIIIDIFPELERNAELIFVKHSQGGHGLVHSHRIAGKGLDKVYQVASRYLPQTVYPSDHQWWQIGGRGGCRVIGIFKRETAAFYPVFIDRHHLIYESEKYNQSDVYHYQFHVNKKKLMNHPR